MARAHLHILLLAAWVTAAPWALSDPPPPLPPGVGFEPTVGSPIGGYSYAVEYLTVDWTHPLLKVGHEVGPTNRTNPPPTWGRAEREAPGVLRLQLIEPLRAEDGWDLGLPFWEAGAGERSPDWGVSGDQAGESSHVGIGGACPWLPGGPPMRKTPEWVSPLGRDAARVGVRWLGRASDLGGVAKLRLGERCLMSWTSPREGRTRFGLMVNQADAPLATPPLVKWLRRETKQGEWLAIHGSGTAALVGLDGWRLTAPIDPRRVERIGLTLDLSRLEAGDRVDWARMAGCRVTASSWEPDFPPAQVLSGRLWPHPLGPSAWISRFDADGRDPPWLEVTFNRPRPVERIELVWASAAGWSEQFDPGRVRLELLRDTIPKLLASEEIIPASGPVDEWTARETADVARVRLTFIEPSRMALDQRARLMALRVWGPWDGESPAR